MRSPDSVIDGGHRITASINLSNNCGVEGPSDDPDIVDLEEVFAYTEKSAASRRGLRRFVARHQHNFIFAGFLIQGFAMLFYSLRYLVSKRPRYYWAEVMVLAGHYTAYGFLLSYLLPLRSIIVVVLVHRFLVGPYTSMVVATNHMGMARADLETFPDYVTMQASTSRTVTPNGARARSL